MAKQVFYNENVAFVMDEIANLLEVQHANPHRIRAYRRGASLVRGLKEPLAELVASGDRQALEALPGIGESLAKLIVEYVRTGRSQMLLRLMGEVTPEDLMEQVPGIGPDLAERIVKDLDIKTLEELEVAAHDGRLDKVPGFGRRRVEGIKIALAGLLGKLRGRRAVHASVATGEVQPMPSVGQLLEVDREYCEKAAAGVLRKIAPKRFNPGNEAWLPVLHTEKDGWDFTALFSNTSRAHDLGMTNDWVVVYYDRDGEDGQATVVTERSGPLAGQRVVRGRERECRELFFPAEKHVS